MSKTEFRVTIDTEQNAAVEEFKNTLRKMADKADYEHDIAITVERVETDSVQDPHFEKGSNRGP